LGKEDLPSHSSSEESVDLRIVDREAPHSQVLLPILQARRVAQPRDGVLASENKVQTCHGKERSSPALRSLVEDFHVQPEVGPEVVSQVFASGLQEKASGFSVVFLRDPSSRELVFPAGIRVGRQLFGLVQDRDRSQQLERKVSLLLFQSKELSKFFQAGAWSQQLGDVSECHAALGGDGRDLVTLLENLGPEPQFVESGHEVSH